MVSLQREASGRRNEDLLKQLQAGRGRDCRGKVVVMRIHELKHGACGFRGGVMQGHAARLSFLSLCKLVCYTVENYEEVRTTKRPSQTALANHSLCEQTTTLCTLAV
jgi:hypothetical protein